MRAHPAPHPVAEGAPDPGGHGKRCLAIGGHDHDLVTGLERIHAGVAAEPHLRIGRDRVRPPLSAESLGLMVRLSLLAETTTPGMLLIVTVLLFSSRNRLWDPSIRPKASPGVSPFSPSSNPPNGDLASGRTVLGSLPLPARPLGLRHLADHHVEVLGLARLSRR